MFEMKRYVTEIVKTGSFSQAAKNLYISQPSLSASIRRLEEQIGDQLFDRSTHPIKLTECGEEYVKAAQRIGEVENNFQSYLEESQKTLSGKLVLGGSNLNLSYIIPPLLKKYQDAYPLINISLVENNIDILENLLSEGAIDLIVDSCTMDKTLFEEYPYLPETLLLAVPDHFPCNRTMCDFRLTYEEIIRGVHTDPDRPHKAPPLTLLGHTPFLLMAADTDTGKREKRLFRKEDYHPNSPFSLSQQSSVFILACQGLGCAIVSDTLIKNCPFRPELTFYRIDETEGSRFVKFFQKKGRRMTFAMRSFLALAGAMPEE